MFSRLRQPLKYLRLEHGQLGPGVLYFPSRETFREFEDAVHEGV
jgi:hypothetical protein